MNPIQPPDGIIITFSSDMIQFNGGPKKFMRAFLECMHSEDGLWLHRCKNRPKQDFQYVYIIIGNRLRYRVNYVGYGTGIAYITAQHRPIAWPRLELAGPLVKTPERIKMRGFQGFRYTQKLF